MHFHFILKLLANRGTPVLVTCLIFFSDFLFNLALIDFHALLLSMLAKLWRDQYYHVLKLFVYRIDMSLVCSGAVFPEKIYVHMRHVF